MSQDYRPIQQHIVFQSPQTNGLGTAGFVCSLLGLLTCGFLSPLGFLFSLFALLKAPRGMAIAGFILGAVGSVWLFVAGFAIVIGLMGLGDAINKSDEIRRAKEAQEITAPVDPVTDSPSTSSSE